MAKRIERNCSVIFASVTSLLIGLATSVAEAQGYRELAVVPFAEQGVDLFGVVSDYSVEHRYQRERGDFERFEALGGIATDIAAIALAEGGHEVFIVDRNDSLWRSRQTPESEAWMAWELLDSATKQVAAARAASGRVELFVVGSDGVLWNMGRDRDDAEFGAWQRLDIAATQLAAAAAEGGGFELAIIAQERAIRYLRFNDAGELSAEVEELAGASLDLALAPLPGGGLSLMTVGTDNSLWERRRDAVQGWSDWQSVGRSALRVALARSGDEVQLFTLNASGAVASAQLTAADASWSEPAWLVEAGPLASRLEGRARLIIPSLEVDKDVPVTIDLRFSTDRSQVEIIAFPSVVTEPFDTPFGSTTSTVSLAASSAGELLLDQGILRLPVTLRFDQSLDLPIIEEDGDLTVTLSSEAEAGQLLDANSGEVTLSGSGRFDGIGSTNPIDGQVAQVIVTGKLTPTP